MGAGESRAGLLPCFSMRARCPILDSRTFPAALIAALTLCASYGMLDRGTRAEEERRTGGKLDLHLKGPVASAGLEGEWTYSPLDGSEPYVLVIRATPGGFYEYEGNRKGGTRAVLKFDRTGEGTLYRG